MDRQTRLKIQNLSYTLTIILSLAYYLSYSELLKILNITNTYYLAFITAGIAIAFGPTRDILTLILGKAMGFPSYHFQKRYQTNHPIEKRIYKLIGEYIPNLHCLVDVIIEGPLNKKDASYLLSIIEEALENTAQHSQAARADVNLFVSESIIKLFVQDDGQGFSVFSLTPQQQGLAKIKRLTQRMGGTHELETGSGGTAHWIEIPLKS